MRVVTRGLLWALDRSPAWEAFLCQWLRFRRDRRWIRSLRVRLRDSWRTHLNRKSQTTDRTFLIEEGVKIHLNICDHGGALYFDSQAIESKTIETVKQRLRGGACFIDIGANYGLYTLIAAQCVGGEGTVLCCEPNPSLHRYLETSTRENGFSERIILSTVAISDQNCEEVDFYVSQSVQNSGLSTLVPDRELLTERKLGDDVIKVATRTLDTIAIDHKLQKIDLIKIDAEGAETLVIEGMKQVIATWRPAIICETSQKSEAFRRLHALGYRADLIEPISLRAGLSNFLFSAS